MSKTSLPTKYKDTKQRAAIYAPSKSITLTGIAAASGDGWTWAEIGGVYRFYSCYFFPNTAHDVFEGLLRKLEDSIITSALPVIVAGDFNAKAPEWGSATTDLRGACLAEMAARLHLHACNTGDANTFERRGTGSVIDVTFASKGITNKIANWSVLDNYTNSDHRYLYYEIVDRYLRPSRADYLNKGWSVQKLDKEALEAAAAPKKDSIKQASEAGAGAEELAHRLTKLMKECCDDSMPRRHGKPRYNNSAYWWTDEIAELRRTCLLSRRKTQRRHENEEL